MTNPVTPSPDPQRDNLVRWARQVHQGHDGGFLECGAVRCVELRATLYRPDAVVFGQACPACGSPDVTALQDEIAMLRRVIERSPQASDLLEAAHGANEGGSP